jgi:hypothetical protein
MWGIKSPVSVFEDIFNPDPKNEMSMAALMTSEKYSSFPQKSIKLAESNQSIEIKDVKVKDPNNPAKLINAKLLYSEW